MALGLRESEKGRKKLATVQLTVDQLEKRAEAPDDDLYIKQVGISDKNDDPQALVGRIIEEEMIKWWALLPKSDSDEGIKQPVFAKLYAMLLTALQVNFDSMGKSVFNIADEDWSREVTEEFMPQKTFISVCTDAIQIWSREEWTEFTLRVFLMNVQSELRTAFPASKSVRVTAELDLDVLEIPEDLSGEVTAIPETPLDAHTLPALTTPPLSPETTANRDKEKDDTFPISEQTNSPETPLERVNGAHSPTWPASRPPSSQPPRHPAHHLGPIQRTDGDRAMPPAAQRHAAFAETVSHPFHHDVIPPSYRASRAAMLPPSRSLQSVVNETQEVHDTSNTSIAPPAAHAGDTAVVKQPISLENMNKTSIQIDKTQVKVSVIDGSMFELAADFASPSARTFNALQYKQRMQQQAPKVKPKSNQSTENRIAARVIAKEAERIAESIIMPALDFESKVYASPQSVDIEKDLELEDLEGTKARSFKARPNGLPSQFVQDVAATSYNTAGGVVRVTNYSVLSCGPLATLSDKEVVVRRRMQLKPIVESKAILNVPDAIAQVTKVVKQIEEETRPLGIELWRRTVIDPVKRKSTTLSNASFITVPDDWSSPGLACEFSPDRE